MLGVVSIGRIPQGGKDDLDEESKDILAKDVG